MTWILPVVGWGACFAAAITATVQGSYLAAAVLAFVALINLTTAWNRWRGKEL